MKHYMTAITLLVAVISMTGLSAQEKPNRSIYDFGFVKSTNPWLTSSNMSGLHTLQAERTSIVEAGFRKEDGGFISLTESPDAARAGIFTESFVRISDRIAFYGLLSYDFFHGKEMGGQVLMDPSFNPVNFVEEPDTTKGVKQRELYHIIGGISYKFNDKWSIGFLADYEAGNQAKRKDPRFQNIWMDMNFSFGGRFAPSECVSIGINAIYQKTLENMTGKLFGVTDKQYFTFVDYGLFLGKKESQNEKDGYLTNSDGLPILNHIYGGSLQIEAGRNTKILNELTFLMRSGRYGHNAASKIKYFENSGMTASYKGTLVIPKSDNLHKIGLEVSYSQLSNVENNYRQSSIPGEQTIVEYFGQKDILDRDRVEAEISYSGHLRIKNMRPVWSFGLKARGLYENTTATIYPYYRKQDITSITADIFGRKNFFTGKNIFTLGLDAGFLTGFGTPKEDGILASASAGAPKSADGALNRDYEYKTASRISAELGLRYTRLFKKNIAGYIEVSDRYINTLASPEFLAQSYRNIFRISVGCSF